MFVLSQALLDQMATTVFSAFGGLLVPTSVRSRATASSVPVVYGPVAARWETYSERVLALHALLPRDDMRVLSDDRQVRVPCTSVTWRPTLFDELLDASGMAWRVKRISGGPGQPFWCFQVRRGAGG
jgi:hypothetical protein